MESEARELLSELREDHRNMAIVLDLLEAAAKQAYKGEDPDFELVAEIMRYMTVYPDAVHHPKFPSVILRPGQIYQHTCIYRFATR